MHDEALLMRWQAGGDADAFRELTQRYGRMIYAAALRVVRNPADAEDVAQDCFEKLASTRRAPDRYLGPWLHRMAVNRALDRLRSETARQRRETDYSATNPVHVAHEWADIYPLVDEAINSLPDKIRRVLVAHYMEGASHEAIAARESVTRSAVTQRIQRGLDLVRAQLRRKGIVAPAAVALAAMLGENLAHAAPIPATLAENLGRIVLAGPVALSSESLAGLLSLKFLATAITGIAITAIVAVLAMRDSPPTDVSASTAAYQDQAPDTSALPDPVRTAAPQHKDKRASGDFSAVVAKVNSVIRGRVLDAETGAGIAGALVKLIAQDDVRVDTTTDEEGSYRFAPVAPGTYHVACGTIDGYYVPIEKRVEGHPETRAQYMRKVTLDNGQTLDVADFRFGRGEGLSGRVVDAQGRPLAGARVTGRTEVDNFHITNTGVTGDDGTFSVTGFPPTNRVFAWAEKERLVSGTYGPFLLPQGALQDVAITAYPEAIIRGVIVDENGNPLPGLKVVPQFIQDEAHRELEAQSDRYGRFELRGMFADTMLMRVCRDVEIVNNPIPKLVLSAGEVVENLELVCKIGALGISGIVVDTRGKPIPHARIDCRGNGLQLHPQANRAGEFSVEQLQPGFYTVIAEHPDYLNGTSEEVAAGSANVRIVLPDAISVSGRVIDAATGAPLVDHETMVANSPEYIRLGELYRRSDSADGSFNIRISQLGNVFIAARAEGHRMEYVNLQVEEGMAPVHNLEIALKPQTDLSGLVHDATGNPVVGALIFSGILERPMDDNFAACKSGSDGRFVFEAQCLGHDSITVTHPDYPPVTVTVAPNHLAGDTIDVQLAYGATVECSVLCDGVPSKAYVSAISGSGDARYPQIYNGQIGDNGQYTLRGLPAGECRIQASLPTEAADMTGANQEVLLTLHEGSSETIDFHFAEGNSTLRGTIVGPATSLHMNLKIGVEQREQVYYIFLYERGAKTGDTFEIPNLPGGPATLEVFWQVADGHSGTQPARVDFNLQPEAITEQEIDLQALAETGNTSRSDG